LRYRNCSSVLRWRKFQSYITLRYFMFMHPRQWRKLWLWIFGYENYRKKMHHFSYYEWWNCERTDGQSLILWNDYSSVDISRTVQEFLSSCTLLYFRDNFKLFLKISLSFSLREIRKGFRYTIGLLTFFCKNKLFRIK
jgi:hypothetical protein